MENTRNAMRASIKEIGGFFISLSIEEGSGTDIE
jgi:hypothetical protein